MTDTGWIKLHRGLLKWEWFQDSRMVQLLLYLIIRANHEESRWQGKTIKRGQLVTGLKAIKRDTGLSIQKIRTGLNRLTLTGEITRKSTNKYSIVTICNYNKYQVKEKGLQQTNNKQITNKQQTNNTIQEVKELKNVKKTTTAKRKSAKGGNGHYPKWLNQNLWQEFKNHRNKIKAPMTEYAEKCIFNKLEKLMKDEPQEDILNRSIVCGWKGVFGRNDNNGGNDDAWKQFQKKHPDAYDAHGKEPEPGST